MVVTSDMFFQEMLFCLQCRLALWPSRRIAAFIVTPTSYLLIKKTKYRCMKPKEARVGSVVNHTNDTFMYHILYFLSIYQPATTPLFIFLFL